MTPHLIIYIAPEAAGDVLGSVAPSGNAVHINPCVAPSLQLIVVDAMVRLLNSFTKY